MALRIEGPGDVRGIDATGFAPSGSGAHAPTWGVSNPAAVAMAGLQKEMERFADSYDDVQAGDFVMQQKKKLDDLYDNPDTGLFATRKGDAAKGMYQESKDTFNTIWDEDAKKQLSERQRRLVSKPLHAMFLDYSHRIGSHETTQLMNAQVEKTQNVVSDAKNLIASGRATKDDMIMADAFIGISVGALAKMQGWDTATATRKKSELMGEAVLDGAAAMAANDPTLALGFLKFMSENYPGGIPEDKYQAALKALDDKAQARHLENIEGMLQTGNTEGAQQYFRTVGSASLPMGLRNKNPGNVKANDGNYNVYASDHDGLVAMGGRLLRYQNAPERGWQAKTIRGVASIYAPKSENDTDGYVSFIAKDTGLDPDAPIDFSKNPDAMVKVMRAMVKMENGKGAVYSDTEFLQASKDAIAGVKPKAVGTVPAKGGTTGYNHFGTGLLDPQSVARAQELFAQHDKKVTAIQDDAYGRGLAQDALRGGKDPQKIFDHLGQEFPSDLKRRDRIWSAFQSEMVNAKQADEAKRTVEGLKLVADARILAQQNGLTIENVNDFLRNNVGEDNKDYSLIRKILRSSLVRQKVLPPQVDITNPVAKVDARAAINSGVPFDEVFLKYGAQINETDMASLQAYSESEEKKAANRKATAFFNEMILKSGLNVNGSGANEEDKLYLAQKKAEFDDMVANNEFKSRDDQKAWIYSTLAKRTKPGMIWDSSYTPREAQGRTGAYVPVPDFERSEIKRAMENANPPIPATEENIQAAYSHRLNTRGY